MKCEIQDFLTDICHNSYSPIQKCRLTPHFSSPSFTWDEHIFEKLVFSWLITEDRQQNARKQWGRDKINKELMLGVSSHRAKERVLWDTIMDKNVCLGALNTSCPSWRSGWGLAESAARGCLCCWRWKHAQSWRFNSTLDFSTCLKSHTRECRTKVIYWTSLRFKCEKQLSFRHNNWWCPTVADFC